MKNNNQRNVSDRVKYESPMQLNSELLATNMELPLKSVVVSITSENISEYMKKYFIDANNIEGFIAIETRITRFADGNKALQTILFLDGNSRDVVNPGRGFNNFSNNVLAQKIMMNSDRDDVNLSKRLFDSIGPFMDRSMKAGMRSQAVGYGKDKEKRRYCYIPLDTIVICAHMLRVDGESSTVVVNNIEMVHSKNGNSFIVFDARKMFNSKRSKVGSSGALEIQELMRSIPQK